MVAQLAAIENQGEAEAAQLVAVNKVDPVIIAPSLLFMIANINNYTTGGNGGAGGAIYSPSGKVRIHSHSVPKISCLSSCERNKYQTPLMSATQLKNWYSV